MQIETPDGPHPDHTREIADTIAESVRTLVYATQQGGLDYPSHLYDVLGHLSAAAGRHPQVLRQMTAWLSDQVAEGHAAENASGPHQGDTASAYQDVADHMGSAIHAAEELYHHLSAAQSAISGMEYVDK